VFQCNLPSQLGMQLLLFLLVLYLLANTVAAGSLRPELQFPNVSSHVAALVAVPSECVPPGSAPALVHTRHNSARFVHCLCAVAAYRCLSMTQRALRRLASARAAATMAQGLRTIALRGSP
jgi:hypothetical protein